MKEAPTSRWKSKLRSFRVIWRRGSFHVVWVIWEDCCIHKGACNFAHSKHIVLCMPARAQRKKRQKRVRDGGDRFCLQCSGEHLASCGCWSAKERRATISKSQMSSLAISASSILHGDARRSQWRATQGRA
eukprot:5439955-Pleurochrysis_carterae.AAC.1